MNSQLNDPVEPDARSRPTLYRRTVLRGVAAGSATLAGLLMAPYAATAQPRAALLAAVSRRDIGSRRGRQAIQSADGTSIQMPLELGAIVGARQRGLAAGSTLTLSWDDRLYRVASKVTLTRGAKRVLSLAAGPSVDAATHRATLSVVLPRALPAGSDYALAAGRLVPRRYPHDLIADPVPLKLAVTEPGVQETSTVRVSSAADETAKPWGAALGAVWQGATWGSAYSALYPALVTLRAVGPGAVPAGSSVQVTLDPQVFSEVTVLGAVGSDGRDVPGQARAGKRSTAVWTAQGPIAAGERVTLRLAVSNRKPAGALPTLGPPLVSFTGPAASQAPQRLTGAESLTRMESIYSPSTLAQFG